MRLITLLTDFGLQDGYPGVMKGVIYRICPQAQIVDLTHNIRPQNILEAGLVWMRSCPYFPEGTIHTGVVDPGVGTQRRPIAARIGAAYFVCPDNGMLTPLLDDARLNGKAIEIVHLNQPRFWLPQTSAVFHGRDIFAPAAAYLAGGTPLGELGKPMDDPVLLRHPQPILTPDGWQAEIIAIDHFGNISTNLKKEQVAGQEDLLVRIRGKEIHGLSYAFGDHAPGELVTLIDSDDRLAIAIVNGSAAREIGAQIGDPVEVIR